MKLATKLVVQFLLLTMIPLLLVGYIANRNGRQTIEQQTTNRLISTNIFKRDEFDHWLEGNERMLRSLARRPFFRDELALFVTSFDPAKRIGRGAATVETQEYYRRILQDHLLPVLEEEGGFQDLFILREEDGLILVSTNKQQEAKYRESEPYFIEGKNGTYVQSVYYSLSEGEAHMTISTPIRDREGELIAVLAGDLDLDDMSEIMMQRSGLSPSEETYLVNTFNFFVTEPRFGDGYALKKALHTEGVKSCLEKRSGIGFYEDYRGIPVIAAYEWMPEHELCILTEVDQAEAFAPILAFSRMVLGIGLTGALVVIFFGVIITQKIIRPVKEMVEGVEQIGQGNLGYRVDVHARDELGQLAVAFNGMAAKRKSTEEALQEANEELEGFSYSVSHDLRAPLRAIDGFSRILVEEYEGTVPEEAQRYLELIRGNTQRMGQLIDDLLDFSRLSRQPLDKISFDPTEIVRDVIRELHGETGGKRVDFQIHALPACQADPRLLHQVFVNLLSNALKFTAKREKPLVEIGSQDLDGETVYYIRDNGVGFDMKYVDKLFGVFQRLHRAEEYEGTGVGLATVQRIIHRHGGRVWAEAEVNRGTTFFFTLGGSTNDDQTGN